MVKLRIQIFRKCAPGPFDRRDWPCCPSPAWWLWRGVHTRSHLELGRKSPQRQWYFVLRRGRVGRCQACERQLKLHSRISKTRRCRDARRVLCFAASVNASFCFAQLTSKSREMGDYTASPKNRQLSRCHGLTWPGPVLRRWRKMQFLHLQ